MEEGNPLYFQLLRLALWCDFGWRFVRLRGWLIGCRHGFGLVGGGVFAWSVLG